MAAKNVCFQCVNDPFLGRQIQRKGISAACSLCNTRRKCFSLPEIVARVEAILSQYIHEGEIDFRWSCDASEQYQKGDTIDVWVGEVFACDNVEPIVAAVCRELTSYSDDVNYSRHPLGLDDEGYRCSGLLIPDTFLGEDDRHAEVFDEQTTTYFHPRLQA